MYPFGAHSSDSDTKQTLLTIFDDGSIFRNRSALFAKNEKQFCFRAEAENICILFSD